MRFVREKALANRIEPVLVDKAPCQEVVLFEPDLNEASRQACRVDRRLDLLHEIGKATNVILVTVGDDVAVNVKVGEGVSVDVAVAEAVADTVGVSVRGTEVGVRVGGLLVGVGDGRGVTVAAGWLGSGHRPTASRKIQS